MTFEDLKELGDEEAVKKAGKLRQQGKKYVVQDADVIFFKVRRNRSWLADGWGGGQQFAVYVSCRFFFLFADLEPSSLTYIHTFYVHTAVVARIRNVCRRRHLLGVKRHGAVFRAL